MLGKFIIQNFDLQRAIIRKDILFQPLSVNSQNTMTLKAALDQNLIAPNEPLITFQIGQTIQCLSLTQMIYHHVAQGMTEDVAWMVSFCVVCNTGMLFSPIINGQVHHFSDGGFYNAMTLLTDAETRSIWNHITGQCLYGTHQDYQLPVLSNPLQKGALQISIEYPNALISISQFDDETKKMVTEENQVRLNQDLQLSERALNTLEFDDNRLPRFDMGLGIWTDKTKKFYPYRKILLENALIDSIDGRQILIYVSPIGVAPEAIYTTATQFEWIDDVLKLNNGQTIQSGVLYDSSGVVVQAERPQQLFQRWYSFSLLFDKCEIF